MTFAQRKLAGTRLLHSKHRTSLHERLRWESGENELFYVFWAFTAIVCITCCARCVPRGRRIMNQGAVARWQSDAANGAAHGAANGTANGTVNGTGSPLLSRAVGASPQRVTQSADVYVSQIRTPGSATPPTRPDRSGHSV